VWTGGQQAARQQVPLRKKEHETNWCVNIVISEEKTENDVGKLKSPGTSNVLCQDV